MGQGRSRPGPCCDPTRRWRASGPPPQLRQFFLAERRGRALEQLALRLAALGRAVGADDLTDLDELLDLAQLGLDLVGLLRRLHHDLGAAVARRLAEDDVAIAVDLELAQARPYLGLARADRDRRVALGVRRDRLGVALARRQRLTGRRLLWPRRLVADSRERVDHADADHRRECDSQALAVARAAECAGEQPGVQHV